MAPSKYITLVSADDFEYVLPREACYASPMLKRTINPDGGFLESRTGVVRMEDMSAVILEKVVEYLLYWYRYQGKDDVPDMYIPIDMCLELLTAADYLQLDSEMPVSTTRMA